MSLTPPQSCAPECAPACQSGPSHGTVAIVGIVAAATLAGLAVVVWGFVTIFGYQTGCAGSCQARAINPPHAAPHIADKWIQSTK